MITKCNLLANTLFYQRKKSIKKLLFFITKKVRFNVFKKKYIYMSPLVIKHFPIDAKFIVFELISYIYMYI